MVEFDLEQAIMEVWGLEQDLDLLADKVLDNVSAEEADYIFNTLIGMKNLHNLRCQKVFDLFKLMMEMRNK